MQIHAICGITEGELLVFLKPEINAFAKARTITEEKAVSEFARWYDGYYFTEKNEGVYNPFCLLKALSEKRFGSFWFESGTPSFLVKTLQHEPAQLLSIFNGRKASESSFKDYDPESGNLLPVIYQGGYLTIKEYDKETHLYTLGFPNREVEEGFSGALLPKFISVPDNDLGLSVEAIRESLLGQDVDGLMEVVQTSFANVPVILKKNQYENYYQTIFHVLMRMTGFGVAAEVQSIRGRSDTVVTTKDSVFIFELKMDKGRPWEDAAAEALDQIERKGYAARYAVSGKSLHRVGIVFSSEAQGLVGWKEGKSE